MADRDTRFREMYHAHSAQIQAYCFRRLPVADANDAAADVFAIAWRRLEDAPTPDCHLPWLYGIARNVVSNTRRSHRRAARLDRRLRGLGTDTAPGPEPEIVRRETDARVLGALAKLRPVDREMIRLRTWEEISNQEIADAFGISIRAVESRLTRARRKLSRLLASPEEALKPHPLAVEEGGER